VLKLVSLLEAAIATEGLVRGGIDGVIVTTKITDGRVKLGAQVVKTLVDKGFVGEEKWERVILTGTHLDRADEEEVECFRTQVTSEFYEAVPEQQGCAVMVSKADYSELWKAIEKIPLQEKMKYTIPDANDFDGLAAALGINTKKWKQEFEEARMENEKKLKEFKDLQEKMRKKQEEMEEQKRQLVAEFQNKEAKQADEQQKLQNELSELSTKFTTQEQQKTDLENRLKTQEDSSFQLKTAIANCNMAKLVISSSWIHSNLIGEVTANVIAKEVYRFAKGTVTKIEAYNNSTKKAAVFTLGLATNRYHGFRIWYQDKDGKEDSELFKEDRRHAVCLDQHVAKLWSDGSYMGGGNRLISKGKLMAKGWS